MTTMLACVRIGSVHCLVFSQFSSKDLPTRIDHANGLHADWASLYQQKLNFTSEVLQFSVYYPQALQDQSPYTDSSLVIMCWRHL